MKEIRLDDKLNFVEEPVEIMDREVKQLKQSHIPIVKVTEHLMARSDTDLKMAKLLSFKLHVSRFWDLSSDLDIKDDEDIFPGDLIYEFELCGVEGVMEKEV
ncbi:hypothetical protein Tco_0474564 [Tanacetum coccineum]